MAPSVLVYVLLVATVLHLSSATLTKKSKSSKSGKSQIQQDSSRATENVVKRGLVTEKMAAKDVLREHGRYVAQAAEKSEFAGASLAYVTPWNSHGYDTAKIFGGKFTYVSPVWLQIKRRQGGGYQMHGGHDIDKNWVADVRKGDRKVQIVPRVLFDGWTGSDFQVVFSSEAEVRSLSGVIRDFLKGHKFDGTVIELWSQLGGHVREELASLITIMADVLHQAGLKIILVIPPSAGEGAMFGRADYDRLAPVVDGLSLMTYDFSSPGRPGPNAPIGWMHECVNTLSPSASDPNRKKILLGLNFYGNDYTASGGGPIVGHQYLQLLQEHRPKFKWDATTSEHSFQYKQAGSQRTVYFPTLKSVSERLKLARQLGVGISIWEIGQGLDYFFDLL